MLNRLFIRLRWPMAVVAAIALAASVAGSVVGLHGVAHLGSNGTLLRFGIGCDCLEFAIVDATLPASGSYCGGTGESWWIELGYIQSGSIWLWWPFQTGWAERGVISFRASLLLLASAPSGLAFAGFLLKRKQPVPGQCATCRYPLNASPTCPECGRAAPPN